jgi:SAM-dependent methyltransferase
VQLARRLGAAEIHGIEFVEPLAAQARARGVHVQSDDLNESLRYASDEFDVVHSNQVIEHLVRTDTFLREIHRVVKPSGYALVSTNNLASWHNVLSLVLGMQPMPSHVSDEIVLGNRFDPRRGESHPEKGFTHLRVFSFDGLGDLARLHGFRVEKLVTAGYYPFPPRVADVLCRLDRRHGAFLIAVLRPS